MLTKVHLVKAMAFPVVMYGCESWTIKKDEHKELMLLNCSVGENSWESLGLQGNQTSQSKGNTLIFIKRTDVEAETPILWPTDVKSWLIGKNPDAGKDWGQEEKGVTEDEMVGWHHRLKGHESEQTPRDSEGQRSLACSSPWGCKESDVTEWLNNNKKAFFPKRLCGLSNIWTKVSFSPW